MDDGGLGDAVGRPLGGTDEPVGRRNIDERTRPAAGDQVTAEPLAQEERAGEIDGDSPRPIPPP
jgi:hypothetical protein